MSYIRYGFGGNTGDFICGASRPNRVQRIIHTQQGQTAVLRNVIASAYPNDVTHKVSTDIVLGVFVAVGRGITDFEGLAIAAVELDNNYKIFAYHVCSLAAFCQLSFDAGSRVIAKDGDDIVVLIDGVQLTDGSGTLIPSLAFLSVNGYVDSGDIVNAKLR